MKPARLRPQAEEDLVVVVEWYAAQGGESLGVRCFDAARDALLAIERMPGMGSPRLGQLAGIEGLRSWPADPFPVRWFYFERDDHLDMVRLLGERQDIEAILRAAPD